MSDALRRILIKAGRQQVQDVDTGAYLNVRNDTEVVGRLGDFGIWYFRTRTGTASVEGKYVTVIGPVEEKK